MKTIATIFAAISFPLWLFCIVAFVVVSLLFYMISETLIAVGEIIVEQWFCWRRFLGIVEGSRVSRNE